MGSSYHEMADDELNKQLELSRSELRESRFTYATARSLQDPAGVGKLKKNIARILTIKTEREKGIAEIKPKTDRKKKKDSAADKKATKTAGAAEVKEKKAATDESSKAASKKASAGAKSGKKAAPKSEGEKAGKN